MAFIPPFPETDDQFTQPISILSSLDLDPQAQQILEATRMVAYLNTIKDRPGITIENLYLLPNTSGRGLHAEVNISPTTDLTNLGLEEELHLPEDGVTFHTYVLVPNKGATGKAVFPENLTASWLDDSIPYVINNQQPYINFGYDSGGVTPLNFAEALSKFRGKLSQMALHPIQAAKSFSVYLFTQDVGTQTAISRFLRGGTQMGMQAVPDMPSMLSAIIRRTHQR